MTTAGESTHLNSYDELFVFSHSRVVRQRQETDFVKCIGSIWDQLTEEYLHHQQINVIHQIILHWNWKTW